MIRTEGLQKRFGRFLAVQGVDLHVGRGEVFGFRLVGGADQQDVVQVLREDRLDA